MSAKKSSLFEWMLLIRALSVFTGIAACIFVYFLLFPSKITNGPSPSPTPSTSISPSLTCTPRPTCLDNEPYCMIPETQDMCAKVSPTKVDCKKWETICDPNYTDPNGGCAPKTICVDDQQTMCTQDAKQCPDGTWVGRTGPNCEFVCSKPH